jgi:hypothetical protein
LARTLNWFDARGNDRVVATTPAPCRRWRHGVIELRQDPLPSAGIPHRRQRSSSKPIDVEVDDGSAARDRWMYKRSGAKVTEVKTSHAVFISHPDAVASVIEKAAHSGW